MTKTPGPRERGPHRHRGLHNWPGPGQDLCGQVRAPAAPQPGAEGPGHGQPLRELLQLPAHGRLTRPLHGPGDNRLQV